MQRRYTLHPVPYTLIHVFFWDSNSPPGYFKGMAEKYSELIIGIHREGLRPYSLFVSAPPWIQSSQCVDQNRKVAPMLIPTTLRSTMLAAATAIAATGFSQSIPPSTALPVVLTQSIAAGQAKSGDVIHAKTLQAIDLPGRSIIPAGTVLTGHIVASTSFAFDATPYATQKPSVLSIHFDSIAIPSALAPASATQLSAVAGGVAPVSLSLRAIAGPVASYEAETPRGLDEIDWSPTQTLIGGDTTSALEKTVLAPGGAITGYHRAQGNFARLLPASDGPGISCDASATEQSIAIFSADACGVYGLNTVSLAGNGDEQDPDQGTFILESRQRSVQLEAGTTALLEVMAR